MRSEIILIGPMGTGKSTLGKLLSEKLSLPQCSVDAVRWHYYKEIGYDEEVQKRIEQEEGFSGVYRYWKPFEAHAVERTLSEHPNCVIDFGAGHSVYEDDALYTRIQSVLLPYENVVLVLPSRDLDESVQILRGRLKEQGWDGLAGNVDFLEHFVKHHSNHSLAKKAVYTKGRLPQETCNEIVVLTS